MKMKIASLFVSLGLFGLMGTANAYENGVVESAGVSGNYISIPQGANPKILPGLGARAGMTAKDSDTFYRAYLELLGAWTKDAQNKSAFMGGQARLGAGVFDLEKVYYAVFSDLDFDSASNKAKNQGALVWVTGGEVGRQFVRGNSAVFVGANSGVGVIRAWNKNKEAASQGLPANHDFRRIVPEVGISIDGRIGENNNRGTVHVNSSTAFLLGEGRRSNVGADVNISKHIQVGGGYRQVNLQGPADGKISVWSPFFRVTLGAF